MNLYEINQEILNCIDEETGEILNYELLEQLQLAKETKIENVALWIKSLNTEVDALKQEEKSLKERRTSKEKKIASLKGYLNYALDGQKFETTKCAISFRKSTSLDVNEEVFVEKHKDLCFENISYKYDKNELKRLMKQGVELEGVVAVENKNLSIK